MGSTETSILIGDVGGTNVRLQLISLSGDDGKDKTILKELVKYSAQKAKSLYSCIEDYLKDFEAKEDYPDLCVIGMAGPVKNNTIKATNLKHWGMTDGKAIEEKMKLKNPNFESFLFINDFTANAFGITSHWLSESDFVALEPSGENLQEEGANSVKAVIGPGTGLGQAILIRKEEGGMYEPIDSEGGHTDFSVITEEDWELAQFARRYIENSNNIENLRGKPEKEGEKIGRLSVERLCAGPAVPLLYCYMKQKHPHLKAVLETDSPVYGPAMHFDDLTSKDIIKMGLENKDPLCMKAIEKFTEILGTETGNLALKTLPYGGIYITGGVADGIHKYILTTNTFMEAFTNKGRLEEEFMKKFKVMAVNPEKELGLLGAEEKARRDLLAMREKESQSTKKRKGDNS